MIRKELVSMISSVVLLFPSVKQEFRIGTNFFSIEDENCIVFIHNNKIIPFLNIHNIGENENNCQDIIDKLQFNLSSVNFNDLILIADTIGRRWKICMVSSPEDGCTANNVLLNIPKVEEVKPSEYLKKIILLETEISLTGTEGQQTPRRPYSRVGSAVKLSN